MILKTQTTKNALFTAVLTALFFLTIGISYYRPSQYLSNSKTPQIKIYKSSPDSLARVKQVAYNWHHTHSEVQETPTVQKVEEPKIVVVPPPTPIEKKIAVPKNAEKPEKPAFLRFILRYMPIGFGIFLIFVFLYILWKVLDRQEIETVAAIPVGIRPRKSAISPNFQLSLLDANLKRELALLEAEFAKMRNRTEAIEEDDVKPNQTLGSNWAQAKAKKRSLFDKFVLALLQFYSPNLQNRSEFTFKVGWADAWSIGIAFQIAFLLIALNLGLATPIIFIGLPFAVLLLSAVFRMRKTLIWVGASFSFAGLLAWAIYGIYLYTEENKEEEFKLNVEWTSTHSYWAIRLGIVALGLFILSKTPLYQYIKKAYDYVAGRLKAPAIGLIDTSFFLAALLLVAFQFILSIMFSFGDLSSSFIGAILINGIAWFASPTEKAGQDKQWKIAPPILFWMGTIGVAITGFTFFIGNSDFVVFTCIGPLAISSLICFFFFPVMVIEKSPVKTTEPKPVVEKVITSVKKDLNKVKKGAKKVLPKVPVKNNDTWWEKSPEKLGMLSLSAKNLNDSDDRLKHLIKCKELRQLYLNDNDLKFVPMEIFMLKELRKIDLSGNEISSITQHLTQLPHLTILELADNNIVTVPSWVLQLPSLKILNLKGNPIPTAFIKKLREQAPHIEIEY